MYCYNRDPAIMKDFIDAAVVHSMNRYEGKIVMWEQEWVMWQRRAVKVPRPLSSVVLDKNFAEYLTNDIKTFKKSAQWYLDLGVPYRRGYLLYGPPGTGKTSFTQAVAGACGLDLCYLNLAGAEMDDDDLNYWLNVTPPNAIILLEDIDGLFTGREEVEGSGRRRRRPTFSGLLNALDGVRS